MLHGLRKTLSSPFWLWIFAITALRLLLVSQDEVVAATTDPEQFITLARQWYYGAPATSYYRLPVFPLFVALTSAVGLPYRFLIEIFQLGIYALLAAVMVRAGVSRWASLASFAWMALLPQTADANNYCFSDSIYGPMLLVCAAFGVLWLRTGKWTHAAAAGVILGLLMHVREERIIALALAALLLAFPMIKALRKRDATVLQRLRAPVWSCAAFVVATLLVDKSFQLPFEAKTGLPGRCTLSTPGIRAFMESMYSIPIEGRPRRYYLIDENVRRKAAEMSPMFRERLHYYENSPIKELSYDWHGVSDLMTDAFAWITLWQAFESKGPHAVKTTDVAMAQAAAEIEAGLEGQPRQTLYLGGTFPINSTVVAILRNEFPTLIWQSLKAAHAPPINGPYRCFVTNDIPAYRSRLYDEVLNRQQPRARKLDATGEMRPAWIKAAWSTLHKLQVIVIWGSLTVVLLLPLLLFSKAGRVAFKKAWEHLEVPALLCLLGYFASSRLAFGSVVLVYFGNSYRYMLPYTLVALPFLIVLLDWSARNYIAARKSLQP